MVGSVFPFGGDEAECFFAVEGVLGGDFAVDEEEEWGGELGLDSLDEADHGDAGGDEADDLAVFSPWEYGGESHGDEGSGFGAPDGGSGADGGVHEGALCGLAVSVGHVHSGEDGGLWGHEGEGVDLVVSPEGVELWRCELEDGLVVCVSDGVCESGDLGKGVEFFEEFVCSGLHGGAPGAFGLGAGAFELAAQFGA